MRKGMKISLIVSAVLVGLGIVMMAAALGAAGTDGLSTSAYITNTYEITEDIRDLDIQVGTADVFLVLSEDGSCKVVCNEEERLYHSVTVRDGVLEIRRVNEREWTDNIGIHMEDSRVTLYLPRAEYGKLVIDGSTGRVDIPGDFRFQSIDVSLTTGLVYNGASASEGIRICTTTGGIEVSDVTADHMELSITTGKIEAEKVTCDGELKLHTTTGDTSLREARCRTLLSDGRTGKLFLSDVVVLEMMDIRRSTGDVDMQGCDAPVIVIETDTGDVTGSLLTGKLFDIQTSTGNVQVPKSTLGGECRITTSTGDIRIVIE